MMRFICRVAILASVFLASLAAANTPPIPPPDPQRLSEAKRLVHALPLDKVFGGFPNGNKIANSAADNASGWMSDRHPEDKDETLRQVFRAEVRLEALRHLGDAINDARTELAVSYARRLSVGDLKGARTFASTQEGEAFMTLQMERDVWLENLVKRRVYDRIGPDLPQILAVARETTQLMNQINSKN